MNHVQPRKYFSLLLVRRDAKDKHYFLFLSMLWIKHAE